MKKEEVKILLENLKTLKPFFKNMKNLIDFMEIDESTYYLWCQGKRIPNPVSIMKLARKLQIDALDLYTKRLVITYKYEFI